MVLCDGQGTHQWYPCAAASHRTLCEQPGLQQQRLGRDAALPVSSQGLCSFAGEPWCSRLHLHMQRCLTVSQDRAGNSKAVHSRGQ